MRHLASISLKPLINEMKHEIILDTYVFHSFLKNTFQTLVPNWKHLNLSSSNLYE